MKEEKYIQSLFEKARHEEPQLSYEEVSQNLDVALNPGKVAIMKDWFFNHIYLNTFIIISLFILSGFVFLNSEQSDTQIKMTTIPIDKAEFPIENNTVLATKDDDAIEPVDNIVILKKTNIENNQVKKSHIPGQRLTTRASSVDKKITPTKVTATPIKEIPKKTKKSAAQTKDLPKANRVTAEKSIKKEIIHPKKIAAKQDNRSELEIVLETALNTEKLKEDLFLKNRNGDFQQLIIKTNNKFYDLIDVEFAGKKSIIISSRYSGSFNIVDDKFLDIQSLKIQEDKAILEFIYNSEFIQVELERIDDIWVHKYTGKTYAQEDHFVKQELLQMLLDNEEMEDVIERNNNGDSKPFKLLSEGLLSDHFKVNFEGKELEIVPYPNSLRVTYAKITKFQVRKKKAIIEFTYQGKTNVVNFKNKSGEWSIRSFKQI